MCAAIDKAVVILVLVTDKYVKKVGGENMMDNCKKEFKYAASRKGAKYMLALVMEPRMRNPREWTGAVGMELGSSLFYDITSDQPAEFEASVVHVYDAVCRRAGAFEQTKDASLFQRQKSSAHFVSHKTHPRYSDPPPLPNAIQ